MPYTVIFTVVYNMKLKPHIILFIKFRVIDDRKNYGIRHKP
jgi:hypothetical protein